MSSEVHLATEFEFADVSVILELESILEWEVEGSGYAIRKFPLAFSKARNILTERFLDAPVKRNLVFGFLSFVLWLLGTGIDVLFAFTLLSLLLFNFLFGSNVLIMKLLGFFYKSFTFSVCLCICSVFFRLCFFFALLI